MLNAEQQTRVRAWIAAGMSDEEIAAALTVSVKLVRPIRAAMESALRLRPR
ncbi:MAG: hypothetical protein O2798_09835 [Chloroflexi bacterium]|nr:hypothetical protein [Chloroflexota bacterium]MDA1241128.1 hypothetical protein [Chloroflexota bacterium]